MPELEDVKKDVIAYIENRKNLPKYFLAEDFGKMFCKRYFRVGVLSALPSALPGLGTMAQIAIEGAGVSADLALMLRYMGMMAFGIAYIYGRDLTSTFDQEFVYILGYWVGVIKITQKPITKLVTKASVKAFEKYVPGKIFQKINQKVGTTILTKWGTKRGGIAVGRLIPFGVGALVGGIYNRVTMCNFKNQCIDYFRTLENNPEATLIMV